MLNMVALLNLLLLFYFISAVGNWFGRLFLITIKLIDLFYSYIQSYRS